MYIFPKQTSKQKQTKQNETKQNKPNKILLKSKEKESEKLKELGRSLIEGGNYVVKRRKRRIK
jgi:hypothetical protein